MAAYGWGKNHSVADWLFAEGYRFDFFQAVKLIELLYPNANNIGDSNNPNKEAVQFKSNVSFDFPPSELLEIKSAPDKKKLEMIVNFLGLAGTLGPLPKPYTALILERLKNKDTATRDFLDIFNHRLISFFYQVKKIHRVGLDTKTPGQDKIANYLYSIMGMGTNHLQSRMQIPDRALLSYVALFVQQPRSLVGLERILSDYFQFNVKGKQFCGQWLRLSDDQVTKLGSKGQNNCLGQDPVIVGSRVWDQQNKIELQLGPLTLKQFLNTLPIGWGFLPLCEMTKFYLGTETDVSFRLKLKKEQVPKAKIGTKSAARLSWTAWLKTKPRQNDDEQVTISPESFKKQKKISIPMFEVLPLAEYQALINKLTIHLFAANTLVIRQGDKGNSLFIINKGLVEVKSTGLDGRTRVIAILSRGGVFGETDILMDKLRDITVVALEDSEIFELYKEGLEDFLKEYPETKKIFDQFISNKNQ